MKALVRLIIHSAEEKEAETLIREMNSLNRRFQTLWARLSLARKALSIDSEKLLGWAEDLETIEKDIGLKKLVDEARALAVKAKKAGY